jgi:hypothetical protein
MLRVPSFDTERKGINEKEIKKSMNFFAYASFTFTRIFNHIAPFDETAIYM